MKHSKEEQLIIKFLANKLSDLESDRLSQWIKKDKKNEDLFKSYIKTNYAITYNLKNHDSQITKDRLFKIIKKDKKTIKRLNIQKRIRYAAAAILVGVLVASYVFKSTLFNNIVNKQEVVVNTIKKGSNKAILTLENGDNISLISGKQYKSKHTSSNGEMIVYTKDQKKTSEFIYNYLTIPRGGQFLLELADGTQVWLNSESQIKYPINYIAGKSRQVELIYGEAYFDVSPSTKHQGTKFQVLHKSQDIEVLGTEFNIKAYKDETNIYTTLVEGKINLKASASNIILKPNQQASLNIINNSLQTTSVDVYNAIAWKDGIFSFEKKPLVNIMKVLSRWYDMKVTFLNEDLKNVGFNGVLGKDQNIEDILRVIKSFGVINDYEIKNKEVFLK